MTMEIQQKYLSLQLRSFLYGIYYNASFKILYNPKDYQRYYSRVLYFDKKDY